MLGSFPQPKHTPCPECGASVLRTELDVHACERERWLDFQVFGQREDIERLASDLGAYLETAQGRFELWYAERERRRGERPSPTDE
jgi:hypothetical protein